MRHEYDYIVILKHVECIAPLAAYKKSLKAKRATQEYFTMSVLLRRSLITLVGLVLTASFQKSHPINHLNDM